MRNDFKIKVCGIKYPKNREAVSLLPVDILGFIFYAPSKRDIGNLEEEEKNKLFATEKDKAGIFVNEDLTAIKKYILTLHLNYIQLHGEESPSDCFDLKTTGVKIIKAFRVDDTFDFNRLSTYKNSVDYFLFDTKAGLPGGTGKKFDWKILNNYRGDVPFFLSGGIQADDANSIKKIIHPEFYGVDLNSGFENHPGEKNIEKLNQFINQLKQK